jgi:hypothetical protein
MRDEEMSSLIFFILHASSFIFLLILCALCVLCGEIIRAGQLSKVARDFQ